MTKSPWLPGTLLGRLDETSRQEFLQLGMLRTAAASSAILQEGMRESHVILLSDGLTKVTAAMMDGRHALLDVRVSGDLVGEISALNGTPRSATVTTCRASTLRVIHRNEFRAFLRTHPDAAMAIAGIVADRLRMANRRRVDFASYPVRVRLARILWEIAMAYGHREREGIVVDIHLTQSELATMCGAAEITLQKALRELRNSGVVATGYRQVIVRDADSLQRCADVAV
ncbi:Crp/Fnr family transcriptional regulator [Paractinoplanes maris]|uniref:Crp/Fnr family transcriptional regulator n=1 Tax=Paractinoplanes maris TaxID=1734446 RepID=UPI002021B9BC|nr:Crp/Fnr family transcriptional regulator [Actinoplanes maris]